MWCANKLLGREVEADASVSVAQVWSPAVLRYCEIKILRIDINSNLLLRFSRCSFPHRLSILPVASGKPVVAILIPCLETARQQNIRVFNQKQKYFGNDFETFFHICSLVRD